VGFIIELTVLMTTSVDTSGVRYAETSLRRSQHTMSTERIETTAPHLELSSSPSSLKRLKLKRSTLLH
jgi:hypothetical protein